MTLNTAKRMTFPTSHHIHVRCWVAALGNSDKFWDNRPVRCCAKPEKYLILLVDLTQIEHATS
jgi:hypothetical protein